MNKNFEILQLPEGAENVKIEYGFICSKISGVWFEEAPVVTANSTLHCTRDTVTEELAREVVQNEYGDLFDYTGKNMYCATALASIHSLAESKKFKNWVIIKKG